MKDKNNKVGNEWNQIIPFYLACEPMARDTDSPSLGHRECLSGGEVRNHWRRHLTTLKSGCRRIPLLDTMRRCGTRLPTDSAPHHCCWDEARLKLRACRGRHQLTFLTEYSRGSSCCTSFINRNCQWMKNHKKRSRIKASAGPIGPMSESSQRQDLTNGKNKLNKWMTLRKGSFVFSDILLACKMTSLMNPSFQAMKEGLALSKMKSFLYFQIC
jgi:hypothetical protein